MDRHEFIFRAKSLRKKAVETRQQAEHASSVTKGMWMELALTYDELATEAEEFSSMITSMRALLSQASTLTVGRW